MTMVDPPAVLNKARYLTERVLNELCKANDVRWGNAEPTLENMIGPLTASGKLPKDIAIHVRNVQSNASPGSHYQQTPLRDSHVQVALIALMEVLEWHYGTNSRAAPSIASGLALKCVEGKYRGAEIELPKSGSVRIGRSAAIEVVLLDDALSRVHVQLALSDDGMRVDIRDCGSTNGTFVNGELITGTRCLAIGDNVVLGTSVLKLIVASGAPVSLERARSDAESNNGTSARCWSGFLEELPLPDVLALATTSRKSGVLIVDGGSRVGRLELERGKVCSAVIDGETTTVGRDAFLELMTWSAGRFELESASAEGDRGGEIEESTQELLRAVALHRKKNPPRAQ